MRNISAEAKEPHKNQIHYGEQHKRLQHRPQVTQNRLLISQLEIRTDHRLK